MNSTAVIIACLAYIVGLLLTGIAPWWIGLLALPIGFGLGFLGPRWWRQSPQRRVWWATGCIVGLACLYINGRSPHPGAQDISHALSANGEQATFVRVQGTIEALPRLTRRQKAQFWLAAQQLDTPGTTVKPRHVTGKLYVTVPLLQGTGLYPGQRVTVTGALYAPQPATNPGGFDFQQYLAQQGCFAGLRAEQVDTPHQQPSWGWWMVQQRIVRSLVQGLGSPEGLLVSSMVLGNRAVDLPFDIRDAFAQVGLAHALAASGFHVSLVLSVVLALTRRLSERIQFAVGSAALLGFVGLAGAQPSVLRAAIMGFGGLVALVAGRRTKPLATLLLTVIILLVCNPLWIWDVGFQLSVLATMGLLVTVPSLTQRLDWLPSAIAPLIAVPLAATIWTLPLQIFLFGVASPYSILVNVVTAPLISGISLGGILSGLAGLIWPAAGSTLAGLLLYPTQGLLAIVTYATQLPGTAYAVGTISILVLVGLYGLLTLTWLRPWWQRRWWLALLIGIALVAVPIWQNQRSLFQITVLATQNPMIVVQDRGRVAVIHSGEGVDDQMSLLPFLQKAGMNQIDWAIAPAAQGEPALWPSLRQRLPIKAAYQAAPQPNAAQFVATTSASTPNNVRPHALSAQPIPIGSSQVRLVQANPAITHFTFQQQTWLWLERVRAAEQRDLVKSGQLTAADVLWWSGGMLQPELLEQVQPRVAIASSKTVHPKTADQLRQRGIVLYVTGQDGAIQWQPKQGFKSMLDGENAASAL